MKFLPLTQGQIAIVDDDVYAKLSCFKWSLHGDGYAARGYNSNKRIVIVKLHHEVIGKPTEGYEVDHINGDKLDNRKDNLRFVTHQQNMWNRGKLKTNSSFASKYIGVTWRHERNKWRSRITLPNGKRMYLGSFEKEEDAAKAYNDAAKKYRGQYAKLNEIMEDK